ncbi:MAG: hypothetical protein ACLU37_12085 [Collinsella sp.]
MIDYRNPYTTGAGAMPKYLAGRDDILESASLQLKALAANYQSRSLVLYGLRGVGKTVLLNSIESIVEGEGILVRHIEVEEKKGLIAPLASACCTLSASLNRIELVKSKLDQIKNLFTSLTLSVDAGDGSLSLGFNEEALGRLSPRLIIYLAILPMCSSFWENMLKLQDLRYLLELTSCSMPAKKNLKPWHARFIARPSLAFLLCLAAPVCPSF